MRKVRRNKTRRGGRSTTSSPLVAWRRMKVTPCSIDTLNTREGVLVEDHFARHDESAGGRHVDARTRGRLRRPQADTESTTVGEVPVAIPASKRHKDTNKAAKGPEVGHGGRGASEDEIGREVATRRLRQTVQNPVGRLKGPRMPRWSKVSICEKSAGHRETGAPHALNVGVLLWRICGRGPVAHLGIGKKIGKVFGHEG